MTRDQATHLAAIFETINSLDEWCITDDDDDGYSPQWGIEQWFGRYLEVVNANCEPEDLQALSERTKEAMCITEVLCMGTDSGRLVTAARANTGLGPVYAQAPNLPESFVNEHISESEYLIFHPKADLELAWSALEEMLATSPDDAIQLMIPLDNLRDQGWGTLMGYAQFGRNADALRARTRQWCLDNPNEGDEVMLEIFGE
jgi:hypothetical protein